MFPFISFVVQTTNSTFTENRNFSQNISYIQTENQLQSFNNIIDLLYYLQSSCWDRNLSAEISANVHPPIKKTITNFGGSELKSSLVIEFPKNLIYIYITYDIIEIIFFYIYSLLLPDDSMLYGGLLIVGPGNNPITSFKPCQPFGCTSCSVNRTLSGAYIEWT